MRGGGKICETGRFKLGVKKRIMDEQSGESTDEMMS